MKLQTATLGQKKGQKGENVSTIVYLINRNSLVIGKYQVEKKKKQLQTHGAPFSSASPLQIVLSLSVAHHQPKNTSAIHQRAVD